VRWYFILDLNQHIIIQDNQLKSAKEHLDAVVNKFTADVSNLKDKNDQLCQQVGSSNYGWGGWLNYGRYLN
jgi:hypothetical protein